jgi:ubiquinone/menaquinone biosynthesis C-methylase UbiE
MPMANIDPKTVASFDDEWTRFDQSGMNQAEARTVFDDYFAVFPWARLPTGAEGFDMGCGTGWWARWVAPSVGRLHCIDPSDSIEVARERLSVFDNVQFHRASVDAGCLPLGGMDFGYSLGALHHVPDTAAAIQSCVDLLKPGAPQLLYLYSAFDNRPAWFHALWKASDVMRRVICRLPSGMKQAVTDVITATVSWPLARLAWLLQVLGVPVDLLPLAYYRSLGFYTIRTDTRDRLGTSLEQRFSRQQIAAMMQRAGLIDVRFSDRAPYWCAVGIKRSA